MRVNRFSVLLFVVVFVAQASSEEDRTSDEAAISMQIGGVGGVYFLASPGELVVEVQKRARSRRGRQSELRAILFGPDRRVLHEATIAGEEQLGGSDPGSPRAVRLATHVERKGVYGLNVTASQDRYGEAIIWGFRTNCPRYLIETSRGHRDERRQEPIVLLNAEKSGDVCFLPRKSEFGIEVTDIPESVRELSLFDAQGDLVHTLPVDRGRTSYSVPADSARGDKPWQLHLPLRYGTVHIDGVTRWESEDVYPNLPCWTPELESYFPLQAYRWILTPYRRMVYGKAEQQRVTTFHVHNNSDGQRTIQLQIEYPQQSWPVRLSTDRVVLGPKKGAQVTLHYTVPAEGQTRVCHIRATPAEDPDFSTYSTVTVKAATAPAAEPLDMPIVLHPYRHENEQFGYLPDYPVENEIYFDMENRPFVRTDGGVCALVDDQWGRTDLRDAIRERFPTFEGRSFGAASTKAAFDRNNNVYLLARAGSKPLLLQSRDGGETFAAYVIPGSAGTFDMEQYSGNNVLEGPPPIVRYTRTAQDPRLRWRKINDLELFVPQETDGRISLGDPILISRQCIGLSSHSGIPSSVVSRGGRVHVVWGEATDPAEKVPGVPTYVATYDCRRKQLGDPVLVAYGAPANDVHNSPSITMDSQGYLHVLAGTHGQPFPYARSLEPNDAHSGWTPVEPVGAGLRQTYIGLVCGPDDTLHLAYRLWRYGEEPFPTSHHAVLAYQRKPPGQPWEPPRPLVVPPFSEYSIFYHRLTIDRLGRLFLSYDYWSTYWFYRTDHWGTRRSLLMSADGGTTWRLAMSESL
jgi:hypothetical protein